jgi:hypothetical protein
MAQYQEKKEKKKGEVHNYNYKSQDNKVKDLKKNDDVCLGGTTTS